MRETRNRCALTRTAITGNNNRVAGARRSRYMWRRNVTSHITLCICNFAEKKIAPETWQITTKGEKERLLRRLIRLLAAAFIVFFFRKRCFCGIWRNERKSTSEICCFPCFRSLLYVTFLLWYTKVKFTEKEILNYNKDSVRKKRPERQPRILSWLWSTRSLHKWTRLLVFYCFPLVIQHTKLKWTNFLLALRK